MILNIVWRTRWAQNRAGVQWERELLGELSIGVVRWNNLGNWNTSWGLSWFAMGTAVKHVYNEHLYNENADMAK